MEEQNSQHPVRGEEKVVGNAESSTVTGLFGSR